MPGDFVKTDLAAFLDLDEDSLKTDLATFFNPDELGDVANYNGNTFVVLFFNEYEAVQLFGAEVESASPLIMARDADILGIHHGARVVVGSSSSIADDSFQDSPDTMFVDTQDGQFDKSGQMQYKVIGIQPDGTGLTMLILSKD